MWWCMPLIPDPRKQKQADIYEFKASLNYRVSSRTARAIHTLIITYTPYTYSKYMHTEKTVC